jgi:hypothetical protein
MEKNIETIVPKLSAATVAMRVVQPFPSLDSLKLIYGTVHFSIRYWSTEYFGVIPLTVMLFSECKRELLGSWWESEIDSCREYLLQKAENIATTISIFVITPAFCGWKYCLF